ATQFARRVAEARIRTETDSRLAAAMIGSNALSWSWPLAAASVTHWSFAITRKHTWLTTSGITGFTLPGMIELPAWRAGSRMSLKPARGPEESSRRSLATLLSFAATLF